MQEQMHMLQNWPPHQESLQKPKRNDKQYFELTLQILFVPNKLLVEVGFLFERDDPFF